MVIHIDSVLCLALCLLYLPVWCLWRPEAGVYVLSILQGLSVVSGLMILVL